jgi:hypothetical protein
LAQKPKTPNTAQCFARFELPQGKKLMLSQEWDLTVGYAINMPAIYFNRVYFSDWITEQATVRISIKYERVKHRLLK